MIRLWTQTESRKSAKLFIRERQRKLILMHCWGDKVARNKWTVDENHTLESAVNEILDDYKEDLDKDNDKNVDAAGKRAAKLLREQSPKRTGAYARSWTSKTEGKGSNIQATMATVYNKNHYQLTHLLEFGHANKNGGRTPAHPHIKKVEEQVIEEFYQDEKKSAEGK